ncbi:hypothetical protein [Pseudomonas fontis]|uniref:Uncharacterized protein n=1 Tax=Pseudomonas fontis TaxID=2942633 RepID=A0ABT5NRG0_9PSED|nr:hypothetical protein [Pseudomonas fontis]MDD0977557.1 hypothetical protein [Pseudomonas fontis]MDD0990757.1 hypothetical protein [Pseudomonas fontis]
MTYGLSVRNDNNYIQIDSEAPRLCCVCEGTYAGTAAVTVGFPNVITSQEPPCVFIRPDPVQGTVLYGSMNIAGGPGAWTGFSIQLANITSVTGGTWFAAVFAATTQSDYGMRIWDAAGNPIYDTGSPAIAVSTAANDWPFVGMTQLEIAIAYTYVCQLPRPIGPHDHFMINPFSRWLLCAHPGNSLRMGVTVDYANNQLLMFAMGFTAWTDIGRHAAVFARIRR